jgi:hypothetical protein
MHGQFNKGNNDNSTFRKWGIGFLALPVLLVVALFVLAIVQPPRSNWISEAVQAEFTGGGAMPEIAPAQLARPSMDFHTVQAN